MSQRAEVSGSNKGAARTWRAASRAVNTVTEVSRGVVPKSGGQERLIRDRGPLSASAAPFADMQERPSKLLAPEILGTR